MSKADGFESFPVYEGIKTAEDKEIRDVSLFESFPVYEGIKTSLAAKNCLCCRFESFPVYEGIKTYNKGYTRS